MQKNLFFAADKTWRFCLCLLVAYSVLMVPSMAHADAIGDLLCDVTGWFTGSLGQGLATLAILTIGIGALMGKVSWGMAIIVGIGVAVIFGAPEIVGDLGTSGSGC